MINLDLHQTLLWVAFPILPLAYVWFCVRMEKKLSKRAPFLAYFFLFGTLGGWFLAFALSPSPLSLISMLLLVTFAPIALLGSSIALLTEKSASVYHYTAILLGLGYPLLLTGGLLTFALPFSGR